MYKTYTGYRAVPTPRPPGDTGCTRRTQDTDRTTPRSPGDTGCTRRTQDTELYPLLVLLVILDVQDVLRVQTVPTPRPPGDTGCTRRT